VCCCSSTQFTCFTSTKVQALTAPLRYAPELVVRCCIAQRSCQYLYFGTSKASKLSTIKRRVPRALGDAVGSACSSSGGQYLYLCHNKASKLRTIFGSTREGPVLLEAQPSVWRRLQALQALQA
jgi:hypothetical protein